VTCVDRKTYAIYPNIGPTPHHGTKYIGRCVSVAWHRDIRTLIPKTASVTRFLPGSIAVPIGLPVRTAMFYMSALVVHPMRRSGRMMTFTPLAMPMAISITLSVSGLRLGEYRKTQ
jgi:hypothetical protein